MEPKQSIRFLRLFFVFGAAMVCIGIWLVVQSLRTYGWPTADGVIRTREIKAHASGESGTTYSPKISYEYEAAGTGYSGETIAPGMMSSSAAYDDANKYPLNKKVVVHYNPAEPSEAVLEPGIHGGTWSYLGLGTAFLLVSGTVLKLERKLRNRREGAGESALTLGPLPITGEGSMGTTWKSSSQ